MSRALGKQIIEALLFAAAEPLDAATIQAHLPGGLHAGELLDELVQDYAPRGVRLERRGGRFALRTAPELAPYLEREQVQSRRLSRAALETLAIIAYHQPITRAELEEMRGVAVSKGTLDLSARDRLGAAQGPARDAGPAGHLGHLAGLPRPLRPRLARRPAADRGAAAARPARWRRAGRQRAAPAGRGPTTRSERRQVIAANLRPAALA